MDKTGQNGQIFEEVIFIVIFIVRLVSIYTLYKYVIKFYRPVSGTGSGQDEFSDRGTLAQKPASPEVVIEQTTR